MIMMGNLESKEQQMALLRVTVNAASVSGESIHAEKNTAVLKDA
jgi:hypothetical protein